MIINLKKHEFNFVMWAWLADPRYSSMWSHVEGKSLSIQMDDKIASAFKTKFDV